MLRCADVVVWASRASGYSSTPQRKHAEPATWTRRIVVLEPYGESLCAAAPTFSHPELLHAVFWIDRLTVALAAAQQYAPAREWCARVERLPARTRARAAPSLLRRLVARRHRCARAVWAPRVASPRRRRHPRRAHRA